MLSFRPPALHTVRGLEVIHIVKFFGQLCWFNGKQAVWYFQLRTSPRIVKSANASRLCLQLEVLMNLILFFSETNFLVNDGRDKKRSLVQTHAEGCIFCTKKMVKMRAEIPAHIGAWRYKIWCQITRPAEKGQGTSSHDSWVTKDIFWLSHTPQCFKMTSIPVTCQHKQTTMSGLPGIVPCCKHSWATWVSSWDSFYPSSSLHWVRRKNKSSSLQVKSLWKPNVLLWWKAAIKNNNNKV